ncbi:MAG: alpha-galactosidase [Oscillospiraceae bacterium]|nr:alpha-galactosidase [Oscillospiraceae bacterium]
MKGAIPMITYNKTDRSFHLSNGKISYILYIMKNGHAGHRYFGRAVRNRGDYSHMTEMVPRPLTAFPIEGDALFSPEQQRQEYPCAGAADFRMPAFSIRQKNGSAISDFRYADHRIFSGKPKLSGLPASYCEEESEAETLELHLHDAVTDMDLFLLYTIFRDHACVARSARFENHGEPVFLDAAMSMSVDFYDSDYELMQFSGAWSRERHVITSPLRAGMQSVGSVRGHSSHNHNPFIILKRPHTTESTGECFGFQFVYSGNFLSSAEVDAFGVTRIRQGIHPQGFCWHLGTGESFQTPESLLFCSGDGLNGLSQEIHTLLRTRMVRGCWRDRERPILMNSWEATTFDFDEEKILSFARIAKDCGIELFVLDDGWFGKRNNDRAGLGDWQPNLEKLPHGIAGLAKSITEMGMAFGLWFEPEMVNKDSDLYRAHPDWILQTPERAASHGRSQYVLDFSRPEVVDCIYEQMEKVLSEADISYVKWDMNRSMTEVYSAALPPERQGEVFHRYILGVYDLYERLIRKFPHILFESCSSGGGRFDAGMLYYAPQCWASDTTDAHERVLVQYGTSYGYPIVSTGAHTAAVPNWLTNRRTPLHTRTNVAYFGAFGYELNLCWLPEEEIEQIKAQIAFYKQHRRLFQFGTFYRLQSPFDTNEAVWMAVSEDRRQAVCGVYKTLNRPLSPFRKVQLAGLDESLCYRITGGDNEYHAYGDELMHFGLLISDCSAGERMEGQRVSSDFDSQLIFLEAETEVQ